MNRRATARRGHYARGMTYVEVLLSVLLISVCLAPAMQTIRTGLSNLSNLSSSNQDSLCLTGVLDRTLSESYTNLLSATVSSSPSSGVFTNPTIYSVAPNASCPMQVNVYILRYNHALPNPFSSTSDEMLYVRAEIPNGPNHGTLTIRK